MSFATFREFWLPWTFVGLLTALCATLAVFQNGWINEISAAEKNRLQSSFQASLSRFGKDFDQQVEASYAELKPSFAEITEWGTRTACARQYKRWSASGELLFRRIGVVNLENSEPQLYLLDTNTGDFALAAWPVEWQGMRKRFEARLTNSALPPLPPGETIVLDSALYGSLHQAPGGNPLGAPPFKEDWLVAEMSQDYLSSTLLPSLVEKYLTGAGVPPYDLEVVAIGPPIRKLLDIGSGANHRNPPDASVSLLDLDKMEVFRSQGPPPSPGEKTRPGSGSSSGRWRLSVYHRGFSLEDQVSSARWRNLALSGGILLLILATVLVLLHYARRSQHLATLQMNFVAGVSHELRTPLTVIRTAAYNLRGRLATQPDQVEKYGRLIQKESEALSVVVEQVLRYGAASAGRVIGERHRLPANQLIQNTIASSSVNCGQNLVVEQDVDSELPMILADELALKHAIQNLLDNAVKYGTEGSGWIGISARAVEEGANRLVEIRVADRGPGIPADEQVHIFDAFFRGKRALQDQLHGTGLGLNLVKSIIEAHGGTISVKSEPGQGAEFIVRLPAVEEELQDVFSHSSR
jgi:signal transduction histidine kinase